MMHNVPKAKSLMHNVYSEADRGIHLDSMFACVEANKLSTSPSCAVITNVLELKIRPGPAGLLFQPVYPANDPTNLVGFATTSIHWQEVLTSVVPSYVNGLNCVISTDTLSFTYVIHDGSPELVGPGDLHDIAFNRYARSVILNDIETGASLSATYKLTVYPTEVMLNTFSTNSPLAVCLSFVGVFAICAFIFCLYDFLMRHEAQQRKVILEMKRRFVRFISHEIRTPLNTVCMGLELLESDLRNPKAEDDVANKENATKEDVDFWHNVILDIKENTNIAVTILNDMLSYDKLETGTLQLETGTVSIWDLVTRTTNQFQIQAVKRNIELDLNIEKPKPLDSSNLEAGTLDVSGQLNVVGDDVRLSQVLRNVISNALKFAPPDETIEVTASHVVNGLPDAKPLTVEGALSKSTAACTHPRAGSVRICVKDSGVGLSKEQLQLLFSEGVQFDANKLQHGGGSGLGLSIAKGIVEQHSGVIWAESDGLGRGTTFIIELPLYEFPIEELKAQGDNKSVTSSIAYSTDDSLQVDVIWRPRRILVAEDAASSRKMLIRLLERAGHTCVPATNGHEAVLAVTTDLAAAEANPSSHVPIDSILMDFEMPLLTGPAATKLIRQMGFEGSILGVTGNVLSEDIEFFKEHGADEVLPKPISMDSITACWDQITTTTCKGKGRSQWKQN
jgi:signal transduction histidine kinase/ActR/RegA family two-component response regulator